MINNKMPLTAGMQWSNIFHSMPSVGRLLSREIQREEELQLYIKLDIKAGLISRIPE